MENYQERLDAMKEGLMGVESKPLSNQAEKKTYDTGAKKDVNANRGRYDLISSIFLERLAIHLEKGAKKYEARNWEKGIPLKRLFVSTIRHAYQWISGQTDEDHLAAVACNLMFLIHTEQLIKDGALSKDLLNELPGSYLKHYSNGYTPAKKYVAEDYPSTEFDTIEKEDPAPYQYVKSYMEAEAALAEEKAIKFVEHYGTVDPSEINRLLQNPDPDLVIKSRRQAINDETLMYERGRADASEGKDAQYADVHYLAGYNTCYSAIEIRDKTYPRNKAAEMYDLGVRDAADGLLRRYVNDTNYTKGYDE